jgi:methylmalonyl-CoA mutase
VGDQPLLTSPEAGAAFAASGASVACLASSDEIYGELAESTISVLKQAGAKAVYLAGKPKDEEALNASGIDGFIFAGVDMIAALTTLQSQSNG